MGADVNVPKLRFPNYDDKWSIKKLSEVSFVNPKSGTLPNKFVYIDLESVVNGELIKQVQINLEEAPSRAQRFLELEDVLFQMVRPYQKNNLFFNLNGDYVASTGYAQIRTKLYPKYLYQYIHNQKFVDNVIERCTGTSYPSINSTDLSNIKISFPSHSEQTKIASFLTAVDDKWQALKKKKELLEQYKKGMMQQLFSQEIRFKKDDGTDYPEWEEKKLGNCLDYTQPTSYLVESTEYDNSYNTPVVTAGRTFILGYTNEEFGIYENGLPVIIFDDFTTASQFVDFPFKAKSSAMKILTAKESINIKFVYEAMQMINFEIGGHGRHWISIYSELMIEVPCEEEQTKIANFLSAIDDKIAHCQSELDGLEQWKKGLLQQMFC